MITIGSNDSQDFSIGKASSTTVVTVTGAHLLIPFSTNSSYRKCNRCRRIKPTTDYANTNAGTATASTLLQEMITIQVLTTARTLVSVKHHQQQ
jgi:hypothetical protein